MAILHDEDGTDVAAEAIANGAAISVANWAEVLTKLTAADCIAIARLRLQISDSTTDVVILRIAGGLPERSSYLVVEGDQGGYPTGAASAQILLTGPRQLDPDAFPPMPLANGEPIHVPSPPIPAGNQSTDDLTTTLGDQEGGRRAGDQGLDVSQAVRRTCVLTPRLSP